MKAPKSPAPHISLGQRGEEFARGFLESLGYEFLDRNWRHGHLELDLIFRDGAEIVFVEVKTRSGDLLGGPAAAMTARKKERLWKAAQAWLARGNLWEEPCRFDVICLVALGEGFNVQHYRNAFER